MVVVFSWLTQPQPHTYTQPVSSREGRNFRFRGQLIAPSAQRKRKVLWSERERVGKRLTRCRMATARNRNRADAKGREPKVVIFFIAPPGEWVAAHIPATALLTNWQTLYMFFCSQPAPENNKNVSARRSERNTKLKAKERKKIEENPCTHRCPSPIKFVAIGARGWAPKNMVASRCPPMVVVVRSLSALRDHRYP